MNSEQIGVINSPFAYLIEVNPKPTDAVPWLHKVGAACFCVLHQLGQSRHFPGTAQSPWGDASGGRRKACRRLL